jgi:GDP-D-mannose dehydratase
MWLVLQQPRPGDYIVATGEAHSVREFVETAFAAAGLDWRRCVRSIAAISGRLKSMCCAAMPPKRAKF